MGEHKFKLQPEDRRRIRFASITQVMSPALGDQGQPRAVLLGVSNRGDPYWFATSAEGIGGWVPLYPYEAVLKQPSVADAAEAVVAAEDAQPPAEEKPAIITGGEVHRTLGVVKQLEQRRKG